MRPKSIFKMSYSNRKNSIRAGRNFISRILLHYSIGHQLRLSGKETIAQIKTNTSKSDTIAVLPEGAMINDLAKRRNPTPITNLMPPEIIMFGENRILKTFTLTPPDYIILVHKDTSEYGVRFFGKEYGVLIMNWFKQNYRTVKVFGKEYWRPSQK